MGQHIGFGEMIVMKAVAKQVILLLVQGIQDQVVGFLVELIQLLIAVITQHNFSPQTKLVL